MDRSGIEITALLGLFIVIHQTVTHLSKRDKKPEINKGLLSVDYPPCWMPGFIPVYPNNRLNSKKLRIKTLPNILEK